MLGTRIAQLRKAHGWNQTQLGHRLGVVQATVSAWEKERSTPDVEQLKRLAALFGTSVDQLVGTPVLHPHFDRKRAWMTTYLASEYGLVETPKMARLACEVVDLLVRYLTESTNTFSEEYNETEEEGTIARTREEAREQVEHSDIRGD